ncbi:MAG TPA: hypothetical protein VGX23_36315 [Actinocrinis sp.]|nr:hypothetical protein [Actinocrinis sp.]
MNGMLEIIAAIGIIGFVIFQQLVGQSLRGKKVVLLPVILTAIGFSDLGGGGHLQPVDIACMAAGCVVSVLIGLTFGAIMRLESRDGVLWAKMPVKGLWLWVALVASRGLMYVVATGLHAHVAQSGTPILLTLGLNRLAQAAVLVPRALSAGVPFAPEKDGKTFMAGVLGEAAPRPGFTPAPQYRDADRGRGHNRDHGRDRDRSHGRDRNRDGGGYGDSYSGAYGSTSDNGYSDRNSGPVDLGAYRSEQRTSRDEDRTLAPTDWRRLAATAAERLANGR